jgi:branched-chain amino acid transport system permease protein
MSDLPPTSPLDPRSSSASSGSGKSSLLINRRDVITRGGPGHAVQLPILVAAVIAALAVVIFSFNSTWNLPFAVMITFMVGLLAMIASTCDLTAGLGVPTRYVMLACCIGVAVVFPLNRSSSTLVDLTLFMVFGIAILGLNLIQGYAGKASLAQVSFLGIGAYVSQFFMQGRKVVWGIEGSQYGFTFPKLPYLASMLIAVLVCFVIGLAIGFPALRVQGPWLAFITVAFNALMLLVFTNEDELTGGTQGIRALRQNVNVNGEAIDLNVFGISLFDSWRFYMFSLACMTVVACLIWWIVRSPWGRSFKAIRDNSGRASSLGVNVRTYTLLAFAIGSSLAGLAGSLYAPAVESIDPTAFPAGKSFLFLMAAVVGGTGTLVGPFIGTAFITLLENRVKFFGDEYFADQPGLQKLGESYQIIFALLVIVIMLVAPRGIVGSIQQLKERTTARRKDRTTGLSPESAQ